MTADPKQAAKEVIAGQPHAAARQWLGVTVLVVLVLPERWLPLPSWHWFRVRPRPA